MTWTSLGEATKELGLTAVPTVFSVHLPVFNEQRIWALQFAAFSFRLQLLPSFLKATSFGVLDIRGCDDLPGQESLAKAFCFSPQILRAIGVPTSSIGAPLRFRAWVLVSLEGTAAVCTWELGRWWPWGR